MFYSEAPFRPICNHILIEISPSNLNKTLKHYVLSHTTKNLYMNHFLTFKKVRCSKLQSQELTCILFKTGTTSLKVHNLKRVFCQTHDLKFLHLLNDFILSFFINIKYIFLNLSNIITIFYYYHLTKNPFILSVL